MAALRQRKRQQQRQTDCQKETAALAEKGTEMSGDWEDNSHSCHPLYGLCYYISGDSPWKKTSETEDVSRRLTPNKTPKSATILEFSFLLGPTQKLDMEWCDVAATICVLPAQWAKFTFFAGIIRRSVDQQTVLMRALLSEYKFDCQHEFWYLESQDSP